MKFQVTVLCLFLLQATFCHEEEDCGCEKDGDTPGGEILEDPPSSGTEDDVAAPPEDAASQETNGSEEGFVVKENDHGQMVIFIPETGANCDTISQQAFIQQFLNAYGSGNGGSQPTIVSQEALINQLIKGQTTIPPSTGQSGDQGGQQVMINQEVVNVHGSGSGGGQPTIISQGALINQQVNSQGYTILPLSAGQSGDHGGQQVIINQEAVNVHGSGSGGGQPTIISQGGLINQQVNAQGYTILPLSAGQSGDHGGQQVIINQEAVNVHGSGSGGGQPTIISQGSLINQQVNAQGYTILPPSAGQSGDHGGQQVIINQVVNGQGGGYAVGHPTTGSEVAEQMILAPAYGETVLPPEVLQNYRIQTIGDGLKAVFDQKSGSPIGQLVVVSPTLVFNTNERGTNFPEPPHQPYPMPGYPVHPHPWPPVIFKGPLRSLPFLLPNLVKHHGHPGIDFIKSLIGIPHEIVSQKEEISPPWGVGLQEKHFLEPHNLRLGHYHHIHPILEHILGKGFHH